MAATSVVAHFEAEMFQAGGDGGAAAVLGQGQFRPAPADDLRVHDFVGFALFQNAVLMDAAGMGEGVFADDGLAALDEQTAHAGDQARGFEISRVLMPHSNSPKKSPRVLRAMTISSMAALPARSPMPLMVHSTWRAPLPTAARELATAKPKIVVAMDADDGLAGLEFRDGIVQVLDERAVLVRHGPADGVRDIDRGRARRHHRPADLRPEIPARCARRPRAKTPRHDKALGAFDAVHRQAEDFVPRLVQLEFAVDFRRGQKNVDAPAVARRLDGFAGGVNVAAARSGPGRR